MALQMIDHVQVAVSDYGKAREFYTKALAPLGWTMLMEFPMGEGRMAGGLGAQGKPYLWLSNKGGKPSPTGHVALGAHNQAEVNAFYQAAMAAGGTDNGPPGLRREYHDKYYAAYVRDPDGNNIEAVWQGEMEEVAMEEKAPARRRRAPARKASAAKKPAARKAAPRKASAAKPAAKKPAARKAAAKKPAGRGGARGRTGRR